MMKQITVMFFLSVLFSSAAMAKDSDKHAVNFCPLGVPVYNLYAVNYEYRLTSQHGFVVRFDYAPLSANDIEITNKALLLNYRWYFSSAPHSVFAGAYTRYRRNQGSSTVVGSGFDFQSKETTLGINAGKRWRWKNGFNVVALLGYGASHYNESVSGNGSTINSSLRNLKSDNDIFFNNPIYSEISIGYTF